MRRTNNALVFLAARLPHLQLGVGGDTQLIMCTYPAIYSGMNRRMASLLAANFSSLETKSCAYCGRPTASAASSCGGCGASRRGEQVQYSDSFDNATDSLHSLDFDHYTDPFDVCP